MENNKKMNKKGLTFANLLIYGLIIMIFSIGLISFGVQLAGDNNSNSTILSDDSINKTYINLNSTISQSYNTIDSQQDGFFSGVPILEGIEATLTTIFGVIPALFSLMITVYSLIIETVSISLGIPPLILNTINSIIILLGIFLAWRVYKSGE